MSYELTHVRHDAVHCLAPGLFRSLQRGERKRSKLDVTYQYGDGEQARFIGFEPLGADDMRLLQGLVALSGPCGVVLPPKPSNSVGQKLRQSLNPKFDAVEQDALVVRESITKILYETGLSDGGNNILNIKKCLVRMSNVSVVVRNHCRQASFQLMSHEFDVANGWLFVALNTRITAAVLGQRHVRIEMSEVRRLQTDPARLIHQRLCGWIDPGKSRRVTIETLCDYIWPNEASVDALKKRRQTARRALAELVHIGWKLEEYAKGKWSIGRPITRSNAPVLPY